MEAAQGESLGTGRALNTLSGVREFWCTARSFNLQVPATAAFFFAFSALTTSLPSEAERSMLGFDTVPKEGFLGSVLSQH